MADQSYKLEPYQRCSWRCHVNKMKCYPHHEGQSTHSMLFSLRQILVTAILCVSYIAKVKAAWPDSTFGGTSTRGFDNGERSTPQRSMIMDSGIQSRKQQFAVSLAITLQSRWEVSHGNSILIYKNRMIFAVVI